MAKTRKAADHKRQGARKPTVKRDAEELKRKAAGVKAAASKAHQQGAKAHRKAEEVHGKVDALRAEVKRTAESPTGKARPMKGPPDYDPAEQTTGSPASSPTIAEQVSSRLPFSIAGIGASAGGLEALRELLAYLPGDTGMAMVILQHLDPTHESHLGQLLTRCENARARHQEPDAARAEPHLCAAGQRQRDAAQR